MGFQTPENCPNPEKLEGIKIRIYGEIAKLKKQEKIDPVTNPKDRTNYLAKCPWANSVLDSSQKKQVEDLLLRYHHILHEDNGANHEFKVKLTPENDLPMYKQGPKTNLFAR